MRLVLASIASTEGHPMVVTARAPYYPNFEDWGDENPLRSKFMANVTGVDPSRLVEVVTYPNNPDGEFYPPLYPNAKYHIYDMVYYWPHIVNITQKVDHPIMVSLRVCRGIVVVDFAWNCNRAFDIFIL